MRGSPKTMFILTLGGHWDVKSQRAVRRSFCWHEGDPEKSVCFGQIEKFSLRKNHGKKNSITRPLVWTFSTPLDGKPRDRFRDACSPVLKCLNESVDIRDCIMMPGSEFKDYDGNDLGDITLSERARAETGAVLRANGFFDVWLQIRATEFGSYTPDDISKCFVKLS